MYHRIVKGEATNLYERSIVNLEADLKYLKENKIKVLSFNDLENIAASGSMPEGNSAIITFDDGDSSWYTLVYPLLIKYQLKATFFLWTYMMDHDSFVTWKEVEDMSHYTLGNGVRPFIFGSHTYSHQYLLKNKDGFTSSAEYNSFLDFELGKSKEIIEKHTPGSVSVLSLPYGDGAGDPGIIASAQRNGYKLIRTSVWGAIENSAMNLFAIPSLPMLDTTDPKLIGTYLGL
jgi:peptidoglycan/xylan/chitin deacetylase (PgdA/CDA1 family)